MPISTKEAFNILKSAVTAKGVEELKEITENNYNTALNLYRLKDYIARDKYHCANGISKAVIIFEDCQEVLKIPFSGYEEEEDDEENENEVHFRFYEFEGAWYADKTDGWDYCRKEAYLSRESVAYGVEDCFAQERKIGEICGYPIYAQEKAVSLGKSGLKTTYSAEQVTSTRRLCDDNAYWCFNAQWLTAFIEYHGKEKLEAFYNFIDDYDIGDLHDDNIGYIGDRPVIIDYSNYYS